MSRKLNLISYATAMALVGILGACNSSDSSASKNPVANAGAVNDTVAAVPADTAVPVSGTVTFGGYTKEDGSAMTAAELDAAFVAFPTLKANYDQLHAAVRADEASGIVTLWDASGNVILTVPAAGVGTIRSVHVTASTTSDQGACTSGGSLLFDLNDSTQPTTSQGQGQGQSQGKETTIITAGFHVMLNLGCEQAKQQVTPSPTPSVQPKDQPKEQPKQVPSPTPSVQPKEQPKQVPSPTPTPAPTQKAE